MLSIIKNGNVLCNIETPTINAQGQFSIAYVQTTNAQIQSANIHVELPSFALHLDNQMEPWQQVEHDSLGQIASP